jgi:hypothetical protein
MGLQVARSFRGTEEQGMIKTSIKFSTATSHNDKLLKLNDINAWMTDTLGPSVPRNNNKGRRRKKWSTRITQWDSANPAGTIEVFTREQRNAVLVALRWT